MRGVKRHEKICLFGLLIDMPCVSASGSTKKGQFARTAKLQTVGQTLVQEKDGNHC
jgi:hypothetical protein